MCDKGQEGNQKELQSILSFCCPRKQPTALLRDPMHSRKINKCAHVCMVEYRCITGRKWRKSRDKFEGRERNVSKHWKRVEKVKERKKENHTFGVFKQIPTFPSGNRSERDTIFYGGRRSFPSYYHQDQIWGHSRATPGPPICLVCWVRHELL